MLKKFLSKTKFTNKQLPTYLALLVLSSLVFLISLFFFLDLGAEKYADRAKPKQFLHDIKIGGKTEDEVNEIIPQAYQKYLQQKTIFDLDGSTSLTLQNSELSPILDPEATKNSISFYNGKPTLFQFLKDLIIYEEQNLVLDFDPDLIISKLDENSDALRLTLDASYSLDSDGIVTIKPEVIGFGIDKDLLIKKLKSRKKIVKLDLYDSTPLVTEVQLEKYKNVFQKLISEPVVLFANNIRFSMDFKKNPNLLEFDGTKFQVNEIELARFASENLSQTLETLPENLEISLEADKGKFSGNAKPGVKIDLPKLASSINEAVYEGASTQIQIPLEEISPSLEISEELQARGIKELHTSIYTTFDHSTANRIHNIKTGAEKYNGLIVKQGETFSFNENLGEVDAVNGFLPELVIKSEGTVPEFGGGLCQVSSTLFRAALFGGLKIDERYPHSYAVGYYAQVLGHGLDATIYPGVRDLKFTNDTPGDLLIQTYVEGTKITFNFYGTKDGRTVTVEGPEEFDKSSAGKPIYVVKPELPPGTIKQLEKATPGFKTKWIRKVTYADGTQTTENYLSHYRTVADKFLVSPDKNPVQSEILPPLDDQGVPRI